MRKDCDLEIFKKMIKHQSPVGIVTNQWTKIEAVQHKYPDGDIDLKIPESKIVFCFTNRGRFKGIVNYKQ